MHCSPNLCGPRGTQNVAAASEASQKPPLSLNAPL